jgi:hypothetical protein
MIHDDETTGIMAIEQFGALCVRQGAVGGVKVLLITTRETRRWTIPKGWPISQYPSTVNPRGNSTDTTETQR